MTLHHRPVTALTAALALVVAPLACSSPADKAGGTQKRPPVVLPMLNALDNGVVLGIFANEVARRSGGSLRIDLQSQWHVGDVDSETDLVRQVQQGQATLGVVAARAWNGLGVRSFDALIAPLTIDSLALQGRVLQSDIADSMLQGVAAAGLEGIGVLPGPMRKPVGISRDLLAPADYRGARIGINASPVAARTLGALGAVPVAQAFQGAPIDGLDGIEQQVAGVAGNQYDKVVASITANVNLWPRTLVLFANPKALADLPRPDRDILRQAAQATIPAAITATISDEREGLGNLCRRGLVRFITADATQLGQLRDAFAPIYTWLREDPKTGEWLDRIRALRSEVAATAAQEAVPSCPADAAPTVSAGPQTTLDGVYEVTTTVEDNMAVGAPVLHVEPENYGHWVLVVDRGRFAFTQENGPACTWGYGTWVLQGQQVQWDFTDGGGQAPTHAMNKPGESFRYGWSLYRDTLTLTGVAGYTSPENFRAKQWRRISTTPSRAQLSQRCPPPAKALAR